MEHLQAIAPKSYKRPPSGRPNGVNKDWTRDQCITLRYLVVECAVCKIALLPGEGHCRMDRSDGFFCAEHCGCARSVASVTK